MPYVIVTWQFWTIVFVLNNGKLEITADTNFQLTSFPVPTTIFVLVRTRLDSPDDGTLGVPKVLLRFQGSITRPKRGLVSKKVYVDAKEGLTFEIWEFGWNRTTAVAIVKQVKLYIFNREKLGKKRLKSTYGTPKSHRSTYGTPMAWCKRIVVIVVFFNREK